MMKQSQTAPLSSTKSKATSSFFPNELVIKKKERKAKHKKRPAMDNIRTSHFKTLFGDDVISSFFSPITCQKASSKACMPAKEIYGNPGKATATEHHPE